MTDILPGPRPLIWDVRQTESSPAIARTGEPEIHVPAVPTTEIRDPSGAGDVFRSGFIAGVAQDWSYEQAAQLGCALATVVLESVGTQEYKLSAADLSIRIEMAYGTHAAEKVQSSLTDVL